MSYVPIYQSVLTHRKTLKLARLLDLDKFSVVGRLIALWTWSMDNAGADGSLADIEPDILADVMSYAGKPSELVEALLTAGFLELDEDSHWRIHDWEQYGGKLIERKDANAARMRAARSRSKPERPARPAAPPEPSPRASHVRSTNGTRAQFVQSQRRGEERREDTESRESAPVASPVASAVASADASRSQSPSTSSSTSSTSRPRDVLWDACADAMGGLPSNKIERGKWAKGIQALRESDATPAEIGVRSQRFRARFGEGIPLHPIVLANNWTMLGTEVKHAANDSRGRHGANSGPQRKAGTRDWDKIRQDLSREHNGPILPAAG